MAMNCVTIFGGSGFVGRHLVKRLAEKGIRVRVAVRDPEGAAFLQPMGGVGQIAAMRVNIRDMASVRRAVLGADAVVNAVGILHQFGKQRFEAIHHQGARNVAEAARSEGVGRFVHVSAIGADAETVPAALERILCACAPGSRRGKLCREQTGAFAGLR